METSEKLLKLKIRLQDDTVSDDLLTELLEDAESMVLGFLGRTEVPAACVSAELRLAQALYNRLGIEGSQSHAEGGVSDTVETGIPQDIQTALRPWRLAKVGSAE